MKMSVFLLFASLCVLACLEFVAVSANDDLESPLENELGIKEFDTLLREAGLPPKEGRFLLASFSTAGLRAFVDAWNTALAALITSRVPGK